MINVIFDYVNQKLPGPLTSPEHSVLWLLGITGTAVVLAGIVLVIVLAHV